MRDLEDVGGSCVPEWDYTLGGRRILSGNNSPARLEFDCEALNEGKYCGLFNKLRERVYFVVDVFSEWARCSIL